ncbi:MAG: thiamine pyrophosphate-dependent dehydrogenase E1 component subunit alpha [Ardenticatenaceae bacterium]|nr:thiamine pyrophosphate-dependent dehydrogenase E1 component subunit alpha [Ardenticatenaceae bacterium]HBY95377.1 pyruvate dehydrogenase (acetyl-transferring) E1 component subunit alpha [Chloroflexota bacterium]
MSLTKEQLTEMYRRMLRIRAFDETAVGLVRKGEVPGAVHTTIGQEAEVVGACMALREDDYMVGNHRSHGHPIGKGASLKGLMAELLGKRTGVNKGKGGSMHLADFGVGSVGETSIVGSGIPVAAGAALGAKTLGTDRVCLCFFGDGASNEGAFHEGLNLASIWSLPVIYLCENNQYAVSTPASYSVAVKDIAERAKAHNMPGVVVDGQDPIAVYEAVSEAVKRARAGEGPSLIEAKTYRYMEHAEGLVVTANYRTPEEIAEWKKRDPIPNFRRTLIDQGVLTEAEADRLEAQVRTEVEEAVEFARQSPFPEPAEAFEGLYANPIPVRS